MFILKSYFLIPFHVKHYDFEHTRINRYLKTVERLLFPLRTDLESSSIRLFRLVMTLQCTSSKIINDPMLISNRFDSKSDIKSVYEPSLVGKGFFSRVFACFNFAGSKFSMPEISCCFPFSCWIAITTQYYAGKSFNKCSTYLIIYLTILVILISNIS